MVSKGVFHMNGRKDMDLFIFFKWLKSPTITNFFSLLCLEPTHMYALNHTVSSSRQQLYMGSQLLQPRLHIYIYTYYIKCFFSMPVTTVKGQFVENVTSDHPKQRSRGSQDVFHQRCRKGLHQQRHNGKAQLSKSWPGGPGVRGETLKGCLP